MFKGPITLSKGLITLGSLGGPSFLFSYDYLTSRGGQSNRSIEVTNNVVGIEWQKGYVTPTFDSKWLSNAFDKSTSYSYGYVARAKETNYFDHTENSKRVRRNLQEAEGELRLVEQVGDQQFSKEPDEKSRNGLTPKKFFLVGVNVNTKDVEVTGLVSLVKDAHKGINVKCTGTKTQNSGPTTIQNGYCDDKVFFKKFDSLENQPGFIETELKNKDDQQVGVLGFTKGLTLTVTFGKREIQNGSSGSSQGETRLSRSAPITVWNSKTSKQENLYTGKPRSNNRPYVVVHDLMFTKGTLKSKWEEMENKGGNFRSLIELGKTIDEKTSRIPLSKERQYYLWDPSYTEIKEGKLRTKNGHYLPWNNNVKLPYTYQLIK